MARKIIEDAKSEVKDIRAKALAATTLVQLRTEMDRLTKLVEMLLEMAE